MPPTSLKWNDKYELTQINGTNCGLCEYTYDALGRRISMLENSNLIYMVYQGDHVIADLDENKNVIRTYTYGGGIDNILAMTIYDTETNTYLYLKGHQGSVIALTDDTGEIVESYTYNAWGRITVYNETGFVIEKSAYDNRYTWQGREYSYNTGLYYFRARTYCPVLGRWLSKDPIGIAGGLNQYVFCGNNPVNFRDPLGLCGASGSWDYSAEYEKSLIVADAIEWSKSRPQWWLWNQCKHTAYDLTVYLGDQDYEHWFFTHEDGAYGTYFNIKSLEGTFWTYGNHHVVAVRPAIPSMNSGANTGEAFILDATTYWWRGEGKANVKIEPFKEWRQKRPIELGFGFWP